MLCSGFESLCRVSPGGKQKQVPFAFLMQPKTIRVLEAALACRFSLRP